MPEVRGVVLPVVPVLRLSAAQAQGEAVTREERLKPEYLDAIRERLEPGSEEKHSHQYRAYARMLLSELDRVSAERDEYVKALEKCAEPNRWHAPCPTCGEKTVEAGCYIARTALSKEAK